MNLNLNLTLARREWLQHRFAWTLMAALPLLMASLVIGFGTIQLDGRDPTEPLPAVITLAAMAVGQGLYLLLALLAGIVIIGGLARRDHADRSIEFWLSQPVGHARSLAVPLVVHLMLAPVAAVAIGLLGGFLVSALLVSRIEGLGAWLGLPWSAMAMASLSVALRLAAGVVLAVLWLAPLIGLLVLLSAWLGRWGLVVLAAGLGLGSALSEHLLGQPALSRWLEAVFTQVGRAFMNPAGPGEGLSIGPGTDVVTAARNLPGWVIADLGRTLQELASPLFLAGLVIAAACFGGLVFWRSRGAGA